MSNRRKSGGHEAETQKTIKEYGWQVICVHEDLPERPGFGYTVGLSETCGHPEVIVFDLPVETASSVLNALARRVRGGIRLAPGTRLQGILEGVDVEIGPVLPRWRDEYLLAAGTHYGAGNFEALQCVWPDQNGRFPGEPEADAEFLRFQPILSSDDAG